jgi:hypothetical protein
LVEPLKSRAMTLGELQMATLRLIRRVRKHLNRKAHAEGMTDDEFKADVLDSLETVIQQDRSMQLPET